VDFSACCVFTVSACEFVPVFCLDCECPKDLTSLMALIKMRKASLCYGRRPIRGASSPAWATAAPPCGTFFPFTSRITSRAGGTAAPLPPQRRFLPVHSCQVSPHPRAGLYSKSNTFPFFPDDSGFSVSQRTSFLRRIESP